MERIFYKKWSAALFIAAILIVVLLLCMLLVNLIQLSSAKERIATFEQLLKDVEEGKIEREKLLEFLKSDDYVRQWAEQHGKISRDEVSWQGTSPNK